MSKKIIWLDNDPAYIKVYVKILELQPEPYVVTLASTITEAEQYLNGGGGPYDLLILDVMIPTKNEGEEAAYPPEQTNRGLKTGLVFYETHRQALAQAGTKVLVLTARIDESIKQGFVAAGLHPERILTKAEVADVSDFLEMVEEAIGKK